MEAFKQQLQLYLGPVALRAPTRLPDADIAACQSFSEAMAVCWRLRRTRCSRLDAARLMGYRQASAITKLIEGTTGIRDEKLREFVWLCGNLAPLQFLAWEDGYALTPRQKSEAEVLREQLAEAQAQLAERSAA